MVPATKLLPLHYQLFRNSLYCLNKPKQTVSNSCVGLWLMRINYVHNANQNKVEWPWKYRSRSKVITCDPPSHASDHLCQIWKESIRNCRCYRAGTVFKAKAKWPWRYRSRSKVIICNTPLTLVIICAKYGKNPSRTADFFFQGQGRKISKVCQKFKFPDSEKNVTRDTPSIDSDHLCKI